MFEGVDKDKKILHFLVRSKNISYIRVNKTEHVFGLQWEDLWSQLIDQMDFHRYA